MTISFVLPRRSPIPPLSVFPTHSILYFIHSNNSTCSDSAIVFHPLFSTMIVLHYRFSATLVMVFFCCKFSMFHTLICILTYLYCFSHSLLQSAIFIYSLAFCLFIGTICNDLQYHKYFYFFPPKNFKALRASMRQPSTPKHLLQKYNRS